MAFLWSLVLPFTCWGTWATPGHAHGGPHFVFTEPPQIHHVHPPGFQHTFQPTSSATTTLPVQDDLPTGAARPVGLIGSLLMLVMLGLWQIPSPRRHTQLAARRSLGTQPIWPTVPTPPPRSLSTSFT